MSDKKKRVRKMKERDYRDLFDTGVYWDDRRRITKKDRRKKRKYRKRLHRGKQNLKFAYIASGMSWNDARIFSGFYVGCDIFGKKFECEHGNIQPCEDCKYNGTRCTEKDMIMCKHRMCPYCYACSFEKKETNDTGKI